MSAAATTNNNGVSVQGTEQDPNLKTLQEFKKTVIDEQKQGDKKIEEINTKLEAVKKQIDEERMQLDELRTKLKGVNEEKDADYPKFIEMRNSLIEAKNQMKSLDDKVGQAKSRKDRSEMHGLTKALEQIERDIQTKKLSKDEERKLVARSKEIATKLHTLKMMHKKEDQYREMSSQYDELKGRVNKIFRQKEEFGNKIGKLKESIEGLVNTREALYEERRQCIHVVREAAAKLEMIETQLNAIAFKKNRTAQNETRQKKTKEMEERRVARQEAIQERVRRDKEYQERWNTQKEIAMKKMSAGEKLTFDEMKLIFGDAAD
ncbi:coiled-coil protein [Candidatus Nitrososphaera sp. FF02]|uniref:coiled-coil protein n=1 Tax=Candidatus Nitrososphaera sp. FF02 TaxID=3398226 RepID=UPI0039EB6D39